MQRAFTQYWRGETLDHALERDEDGPPTFEHTADNMFRSKGIKKGDKIFLVS